jgi:pimeloyl-ACP methyl ester carboxylesterase
MYSQSVEQTGQVGESSVESFSADVGGSRLHCLKAGAGPAVVLMHGGASDSSDWVETMDALSDSYSLYAPDMIGYGQSDKSKEAYSLSDFVKATHGLIQKLNLSTLVLVGHSLGGRVCIEIALRHPELVAGLVLVDSPGFAKLAWWGGFLGAAAWGIRSMLGRPQPYPRFRTEAGEDRNWRCLDRLPALNVPTLLVWNRRDPYYSMSGALKAAELIPNVQLEIFPRYGHAPHKQDREGFNRTLLRFLNAIGHSSPFI